MILYIYTKSFPQAATDMPRSLIDRALQDTKRDFPQIDELARGIVYCFFFFANHFSRRGSRLLEQFGLSWGEYLVITTLRRKGTHGGLSPSALCESTGMSTGGLSNLLRRLETGGLVKRAPSTRDRRGVHVTITARGRRLAERALLEVSADQDAQIGALSRSERARLYAQLRTLVAHLEYGDGTRATRAR